jgi:hypothetical protein
LYFGTIIAVGMATHQLLGYGRQRFAPNRLEPGPDFRC